MFDVNKILGKQKKKTTNKFTDLSLSKLIGKTPISSLLNTTPQQPSVPLFKQKQWADFSIPKRQQMRAKYKDTDGDRVPDKWDCSPKNVMRQDFKLYPEQFSPKTKNFSYPNYKQKVVMMPVDELFHKRAKYNIRNTEYVWEDAFGPHNEARERYMKEHKIADADRWRVDDNEIMAIRFQEKKKELEGKGYTVYPPKIKKTDYGKIKEYKIKYRRTPKGYKQEAESVMSPSNWGDGDLDKAEHLMNQGVDKDKAFTQVKQGYVDRLQDSVESDTASVPMLKMWRYDALKHKSIGEGRHRILAAKAAGLKEIPVFIDPENRLPDDALDRYRELSNKEIRQYVPELRKPTVKTVSPYDIKTTYEKYSYGPSGEQTIQGMTDYVKKGGKLPPILVDESGELIDGRHRLQAYKRLEVKDVPVIQGLSPFAHSITDKEGNIIPTKEGEVDGQAYAIKDNTQTQNKLSTKVNDRLLGDKDNDGVMNAIDCDPDDPDKQGGWHKVQGYPFTLRKKFKLVNPDELEASEEVEWKDRKNIDDIKKSGEIRKPIKAWNKYWSGQKYQVSDGHHRMIAAQERGDKKVPVELWDKPDNTMYYRQRTERAPFNSQVGYSDLKGTFKWGPYLFDVAKAGEVTKQAKVQSMPASKELLLPLTYVNKDHLKNVDTDRPVVFAEMKDDQGSYLMLIDGAHRVTKAAEEGKNINYVVVPNEELDKVKIRDLTQKEEVE